MASRERVDRLLLAGSHSVNSLYNRLLTPILPLIVVDFGLSYAQAGFIVSAYAIGNSLFQLPISFAADYFGKKRVVLALSLLFTALPVFFYGYASSYPVFLLLVLMSGVGSSAFHPAAVSLISRVVPNERSYSMGLFKAGGDFGNIFAPAVIGFLAVHLGSWRTAAQCFVLPGTLWAAFVWTRFRDLPVERGSFRSEAKSTFRDLLANRPFLGLLLLSSTRVMSLRGTMAFLPLLLAESFGLNAQGVGWVLTSYFLLGTAGSVTVGKLSDGRNQMAFVMTMLAVCAASLTMLPWAASLLALAPLLAFMAVTINPIQALILSVSADLIEERQHTSSVGMLYSVNEVASSISPFVGGMVAEAVGLRYSFLFYAGLCLLGAAVSALVSRSRVRATAGVPLEKA